MHLVNTGCPPAVRDFCQFQPPFANLTVTAFNPFALLSEYLQLAPGLWSELVTNFCNPVAQPVRHAIRVTTCIKEVPAPKHAVGSRVRDGTLAFCVPVRPLEHPEMMPAVPASLHLAPPAVPLSMLF